MHLDQNNSFIYKKNENLYLKKFIRDWGYYAHHLYEFLNDYVEPNESEPILRNF
jgi:hypothetical protein